MSDPTTTPTPTETRQDAVALAQRLDVLSYDLMVGGQDNAYRSTLALSGIPDMRRAANLLRDLAAVSTAAPALGQNRSETATVLAKREVRSALASVLCNAANYPAEVGAHILGRDLSRLVDAATAAALAARPAQVEYGLVWDDLGSADVFPTIEQARAAARGFDEPAQVVRIETWPVADEGAER